MEGGGGGGFLATVYLLDDLYSSKQEGRDETEFKVSNERDFETILGFHVKEYFCLFQETLW